MSRRSLTTRSLSLLLVGALQSFGLAAVAGPLAGSVAGTIVDAESREPLSGARVHLADPRQGTIHSSAPAGPGGRFTVPDVPPGIYEVGVQSGDGLYLVEASLTVVAGDTRPFELAIRRGTPSPAAAGPRVGVWSNPLTSSLIVTGAAFVLGAITTEATDDDEERVASPF